VAETKIDWNDPVQVKAYRRRYNTKNRDKIKEWNKKYYARNKDKILEQHCMCSFCGSHSIKIEYNKGIEDNTAYEIKKCGDCGKAEARKIGVAEMKLKNLGRIFKMETCPLEHGRAV
jgi:hypothetical protein